MYNHNSIISLCICVDSHNDIYLVKTSKGDNNFPLGFNENLGRKLNDLKIDGNSRNQLIDLVYDTLNYSFIQRTITIDKNIYFVFSIVLSSISKNFKIINTELSIYPEDSTVLMYFSDITTAEENLIKRITTSMRNFDFSIVDIFKFFGLRNIALFFLLIQLLDFIITDKAVTHIIEKVQENFVEILAP